MKLRELLNKIRPDPKSLEGEGERPVDNDTGWAAGAQTRGAEGWGASPPTNVPPNYVPPADEGRPRH